MRGHVGVYADREAYSQPTEIPSNDSPFFVKQITYELHVNNGIYLHLSDMNNI